MTALRVELKGWEEAQKVAAPLQAAEFYRGHGFVAEGKVFREAGMLQQKMRKPLAEP